MSRFSEEKWNQIRDAILRAPEQVDTAIPLSEDFTIQIESQPIGSVNREWRVEITVTSTSVIGTGERYERLRNVNEDGEAFVEAWATEMEALPVTKNEWVFYSTTTASVEGLQRHEYQTSLDIKTEDALDASDRDKKLLRISYNVPRECYVIADDDVSESDVTEVLGESDLIQIGELPAVPFPTEFAESHPSTEELLDHPTIDRVDVEDLSIENVRLVDYGGDD